MARVIPSRARATPRSTGATWTSTSRACGCSGWRASRSRRPATRRAWTWWRASTAAVAAQATASATASPRAGRGGPGAARRAEAPRLPHARPAREGAQEGRSQEGPQAAAVLKRSRRPWKGASRRGRSSQAVRHRRCARCGGRVPDRRARHRLGPRGHPHLDLDAPQVIVRDTRESGEMLEAALAAGVASAGGHALLGGVLPTPGASVLARRFGSTWPRWYGVATIPTRTTGSSSSARRARSSTTSRRPRSSASSTSRAGDGWPRPRASRRGR